jgi:hypothetical protein
MNGLNASAEDEAHQAATLRARQPQLDPPQVAVAGENGGMPEREERRELRGALARGEGAAVLRLLGSGPWPEDCLQLAGDGLRVALGQHVGGAEALARECVARLRTREWDGDDDLADALEAQLGSGPVRLLRPLAVDLEELAMVLEGDPLQGSGRIDLISGEVWPQAALDYAVEVGEIDEDGDDPARWLWVNCEGSRSGYRDMQVFIASLDDAQVADRLDRAISGRGAFRRFKDTLSAWPDLMTRWHAFSEDRQRGRARAWLADAGYAAVPTTVRG